MKMTLKNYLFSVMGMNAYIFLFLSLLMPNSITVKHFHLMVCASIPVVVFAFLTFEYQLFSKRLWIRRTVVIAFSVANMLLNSYLFGYLQPTKKHFTVYGIAGIAVILFLIFYYYVADRIEKKNLEAINQKLRDNNEN